MSYTYNLQKLKDMGGNLAVKELSNEKLETWHFVDLLMVSHEDDKSFKRCKRWLFENHPELII